MNDNNILISRLKGALPWNLLLLADPYKEMIEKYIDQSAIFVAKLQGKEVGVIALKIHNGEAEIMNVAVAEDFQARGIGTVLIKHVINFSKSISLSKVMIGTADTSKLQLTLYKKLGFSEMGRIPNFFIENYPDPIIENEKRAKDMIRLEINLS